MLSSVELGAIAELVSRGSQQVRDLIAARDVTPLVALAAPPARYLQIEAEALFAALVVRERIAPAAWVMRWLTELGPRSPWLGLALVRDRVLGEPDLPWLFETRRLLHGRAQAWQASGFLDELDRGTDPRTALDRWLSCPRDPTASSLELLARSIPRALALLDGADLDAAPAPAQAELRYEGLVHGYRIVQALSHGSRGVVYRARHVISGREVALKIIPLRHPNNHGRAAEFWREAVALGRVDDPRIPAAYDFGGCKEYYYYASELVSGTLLRDTPLEPRALVSVARDVALALTAIRDAGLVHRDVIPSNILIGTDGTARLLDFGDAWFHSDVRVPGRGVPGTIPYIAPEEAAAIAPPDERSDIYMLGVVLHERLAGLPFDGDEHAFRAWIATAVLPAVCSGLPALDELVARMTRRRPDDRVGSLEQLIDSFDHITGSTDRAQVA